MGWAPRPATDDELAVMADATREWIEAGAGALSIGLDYQPSAHADLRELVALSRLVGEYGGVYAAHIRKQALDRRKAWEETLDVARQAGIPVHISHERVDAESADLLDRADREGIDVTFDSYLYPAGMTHLAIFLPLDVQAGSLEDMLRRMRDPNVRARSLPYLREKLGRAGNQIVGYTKSGRFIGLTLAEAADAVGKSWEAFAYDLILEEEGIETWIIPWLTSDRESERMVRQTATHPQMMVASDGIYSIPHPHPRGYGCFARMLRRFVREEKLLPLEKAVRKMSGQPAQRFGLSDRGRIAEGLAADLVVFDPATVADHATWQEPRAPVAGVGWVLVNGVPVIQQGKPTGQLPGHVLRRSG
jgi:N-acyl-D-amino-acid deacylase